MSCTKYLQNQTDRPSSQFWNSGMVLAHKEMVAEFDVPITHITEQSMHNKVNFIFYTKYIFLFIIQDTADGEFSVVKTPIARYLARSNASSLDYVEVKDSKSVVKFFTRQLSNPSRKNGIQDQTRPEVFLLRKEEALSKVKTLAGISTNLFEMDGTVRWRRYACFCANCFKLQWSECSAKKMVGDMKIVNVKKQQTNFHVMLFPCFDQCNGPQFSTIA